jgi:putative heme-binding domain-containing protein
LFEKFLPEELRAKKLGSVVDVSALLAIEGDAERGRTLFFEVKGVQCKNCHRIGDVGSKLGPELTVIGKKNDRAKLLESMLEPSKFIDPKYVMYLVETTAGRVHTGLLIERTAKEIVLRTAKDKPIRIPTSDVEQIVPQRQSLMPELLLRDMTAEQVADLLAFLSALK